MENYEIRIRFHAENEEDAREQFDRVCASDSLDDGYEEASLFLHPIGMTLVEIAEDEMWREHTVHRMSESNQDCDPGDCTDKP